MPSPVSFNPLLGTNELSSQRRSDVAGSEFRELLAQELSPTQASRSVVTPVRTRLSGTQAADALRSAWSAVTGEAPSRETLAVLTAQWAHETGRGASMYNYNFGGIKGHGPSGLTVELKTREGWGATERTIVDGFRAYRTPTEGAIDYVKLLTSRYKGATEAARRGDAVGFVRSLKAGGYFTGNEAAYVRSVSDMSEAALSQGFSALGEGGRLPRNVTARATSRVTTSTHEASSETYEPATPFVDVMTIADEISRAALRIAADNERQRIHWTKT